MRTVVFKRAISHIPGTRAIHWLTGLGLVIATGMLALGGAILLDARVDAWQQAEHASQNLILALSRDISRNITLYDLSIQGVREALSRPDLDQISPETRQLTLFDRAATAEYLGSLVALNENGDIIADSTAIEPHKLNFSDREHFKVHQERSDVDLFISRPFRSRLRGGEPSIAISRRMSRPDGSFGGVVVGAMRLAYFSELFAKLELGSAGAVTLFRSDGRVIMRKPFRDIDLDRDLSDTPLFRRYLESDAGTVVGKATLDGVTRHYTFRHLEDLPLILSVAVSVDDIYAAWWRKAIGIGSVLCLLCGTTVALCLLFRREILRRLDAERGLREAAEQLSIVAATDGLTGLANRRAFEERLTLEWNRSVRAQTCVALLMLDADFFKLFNDRYGHPAGDQVLKSIAACISSNTRRPADTGARYGGEEFVALLPETDMPGALFVAERIRNSIARLQIPHEGNPVGYVTVSIGVAVAYPVLGQTAAPLMDQADGALYEAKHSGRNRVRAAGASLVPQLDWVPAGAFPV